MTEVVQPSMKIKKEKRTYKPKTLMENHPIEVNPSNIIKTPTGKVTIPVVGEKKKKKKTCDGCDGDCHCEGWNSKVKNSEERFY